MTSRERLLKTLNFEEPDRVPIDLGGTIMSGIMAHALDRLLGYLGLKGRPVKVYEVFQMLGEVEAEIIERLGIDVLPVEPPVQFFGLQLGQAGIVRCGQHPRLPLPAALGQDLCQGPFRPKDRNRTQE